MKNSLTCAVVVAALASTAVLGACGSDDDSDGAAASGGAATATNGAASVPTGETPDERAVLAAVADLQAAMDGADGEAACPHLSRIVRKGFARMGDSCEDGFTTHFSGEVTEDPNPKIHGVEVEGQTAMVNGRGRRLYATENPQHTSSKPEPVTATFVKEQGQWRLREWFTD